MSKKRRWRERWIGRRARGTPLESANEISFRVVLHYVFFMLPSHYLSLFLFFSACSALVRESTSKSDYLRPPPTFTAGSIAGSIAVAERDSCVRALSHHGRVLGTHLVTLSSARTPRLCFEKRNKAKEKERSQLFSR